MRKLHKIFDRMMEEKKYFCLQYHGKFNDYFNLAMKDREGVSKVCHADNLKQIEEFAFELWGHLLETPKKPSIPKPAGMPLPPGMR